MQLQDTLETVLQQLPQQFSFRQFTEVEPDKCERKLATSAPEVPEPIVYPSVGDMSWYQLNVSPDPAPPLKEEYAVKTEADPSYFAQCQLRNIQTKNGERSLPEIFAQFSNTTLPRDQQSRTFRKMKGNADEVEAAVLFYSLQEDFIAQLETERQSMVSKLQRRNESQHTKFYALALNAKDVSFISQDPDIKNRIILVDNVDLDTLLDSLFARFIDFYVLIEIRKT